MLQASSSTVSHVLGQTNAAEIGIILQYFMNAPQYVFVKAQLMIRFQTRIFHIHLRPAHGCAMLLAPKNSWTRERRKDFSLHNVNNLGDSLTCLS